MRVLFLVLVSREEVISGGGDEEGFNSSDSGSRYSLIAVALRSVRPSRSCTL